MRKTKLSIALIIILWICFIATGITLILQLSMESNTHQPGQPSKPGQPSQPEQPDPPIIEVPTTTIDVASEEDLVAAFSKKDANIKFVEDIEIVGNGGTLRHSENSTIELDGHNLTGVIENSGSLVICNTSSKDSVISAQGDTAIINCKDLKIAGGVSVAGSVVNETASTLTISGTSDNKTTIYSESDHSINNEGYLVIEGDVTVYCSRSVKSSAIYNADGGIAAIRGGTFLYKQDTELTDAAWYVIFNAQDAIITEFKNATVCGDTHASLVENFGQIKEFANVNLENSVNVIKNEPSGVINKISSGTFTMTKGYENNANGNASVILNYGKIKEIAGGEFVISDTAYPVTTSAGRLAVITNNGSIDNISAGTFRSETTEMHDIVYNAGSLAISGGNFTGEEGIVYVVYNGNKLNISDGYFISNAATEHYVIFTYAVVINSETVYGTTDISGGMFKLSEDATGNSKVVWSMSGLSSKAQTRISGGVFYGDMNMGTIGPTSPIQYNIVISGGLFDRELWRAVNGGSWKLQGIVPERAVIYTGVMYRVVEKTALTYTDMSAEAYIEAMIPSTNPTNILNMYYSSSQIAMESVFEMKEYGYEVLVKLYVSDATNIVLPLGEELTIVYEVDEIQYTGTVSAAEGSKSTTFWDWGENDHTVVYQYNIDIDDATVSIIRDGQEIWYSDLVSANNKAKDGDEIKIIKNHALTEQVVVKANNLILDLNGKEVTSSTIILYFNSDNTVENFTLRDSIGTGKLVSSSDPIRIYGAVTMKIESGTFESTKSSKPNSIYKSTSKTVAVVITGGVFNNSINGASSTWLTIQGGTFAATDPARYVGGQSSKYAVLRDGSTFYVVNKEDLQYSDSTADNYYEAVIPTNQTDDYADYYYTSSDAAISDVFALGAGYNTVRPTIELYVSSSQDVVLSAYSLLTIYYKASGVQYTGNVSVPDNYTLSSKTLEGGVSYEAQLSQEDAMVSILHGETTRYYLTLADAFKFVLDGDKITVIKEHTTTGVTLTANNVTLDLNGKTITSSSTAITVDGAQNFTIEDTDLEKTGKIYSSGTASTYCVFLKQNATVTIKGGTFSHSKTTGYPVRFFGGFVGTLTIEGGTFDGGFNNPTAETLIIKGGSFKTDPTEYVAATSTVTGPNDDGYYIVTPKS